jgi:TPR repeat protein
MSEEGKVVPKDDEKAREWYQKAADLDHPAALRKMGLIYLQGDATPENVKLASEHLLKASRIGDLESQYRLGLLYSKGLMDSNDGADAAKWFASAARRGHVPSMFELGLLYAYGKILSRNRKEALEWLRKAKDGGHPEAETHIEALLAEEKSGAESFGPRNKAGTKNDYLFFASEKIGDKDKDNSQKSEAERLAEYLKDAEEGSADAMFNAGVLYATGLTIIRDYQKSFEYFHKASELDHAEGAYNLAFLYKAGLGTEKSQDKYLEYLRKSSSVGCWRASFILAITLDDGALFPMGPDNFSEARETLLLAARQGSAEAQFIYGNIILRDSKDDVYQRMEGLNWIISSAEKGHSKAIDYLRMFSKNMVPELKVLFSEFIGEF